jgi:hypothetical protein
MRPFQKTKLKSVLSKTFLIIILLINLFVLQVNLLESFLETDLVSKRIAEKQTRLSFSLSIQAPENGSDQNKTVSFPSVILEDLDLDEDDLGTLPRWDGKKSFAFTCYCLPSEIRVCLEQVRTLDKPPQLI